MKNIEENNKLIALFMGYDDFKAHSSVRLKRTDEIDAYTHILKYEKLKYHASWDWLMPVVEKIEQMKYNIRSTPLYTRIGYDCEVNKYSEISPIITIEGETKLKATYKAVVEFIKWYNSQ